MDGVKFRNVTLFLGKLPNRKQECFYFSEGNFPLCPVAYIRADRIEAAKRLWAKMLDSIEEDTDDHTT